MPVFTNTPPNDPRGNSLPILRTPPNKPLRAIATSSDLLGCPTHFYGGRTVPCETPDCEPCRKGLPWRWHAYLGALMSGTRIHFLFECTARIAQEFVAYREAHGTLRGCLFSTHRPSRTPNGRVHMICQPANLEQVALPKEPDVVQALAIIWNLGTPAIDVSELLRNMPRISIDQHGNGEQLAPDPQP